MDWITDLPECDGFTTLLVVCEKLTSYTRLIPCRADLTAEEFADLFVSEIVRHEGWPAHIISDRDKLIRSKFWVALNRVSGGRWNPTTGYHPQADGQNERLHIVIEDYLRSYVAADLTDWVKHLPLAELSMNTRHMERLQCSPFWAVKGRDPMFPLTLELAKVKPSGVAATTSSPAAVTVHARQQETLARCKLLLEAANQRAKSYYDKRKLDHPYRAGQQVWLSCKNLQLKGPHCKKLQARFVGPYEIVEMVGPLSAKLALPPTLSRIHPVFHVSLLKPFHTDGREQPSPGPILVLDDNDIHEEYEIDYIVGHRNVGRAKRLEFCVHFIGYGDDHNEWLPEANLVNAPELVALYWQELANRAKLRQERKRRRSGTT